MTETAFVLWLTGLSGSGKTTVARLVAAQLERRGLRVERLDGDDIRKMFPGTGFSKADRDLHVRRVGHMASLLESKGICVVASLVSPYAESRRFVRGLCRRFFEVHVSTPLEVCEKRDVKGLYARARRGEVEDFTGVQAPYEPPRSPELTVDTSLLSPEQAAQLVLDGLKRRFPGAFA